MVAMVAGYSLLSLFGVWLARHPGNVAVLWFANAFAVGLLLSRPTREAPGLLVAQAAANSAANIFYGDPLYLLLAFSACNAAETGLAAFLLVRSNALSEVFDGPVSMIKALVLGALIPALVGATLGGGVLSWAGLASFKEVWLGWFIGDAYGYLAFFSLIATLTTTRFTNAVPHRHMPNLLWAGLATATTWVLFSSLDRPLSMTLAVLVVVLIWAPPVEAAIASLATALLLAFLNAEKWKELAAEGLKPNLIQDFLPVMAVFLVLNLLLSFSRSLASANDRSRENERFMRSLTNDIPGMVGYWDVGLRNRFANAAYREWFGRSPNEMAGMHISQVLGPEIFERNRPYIEGALRGERQSFARTLTKTDGTVHHSWAEYIPDIRDGVVQGFVVLVTDVTKLTLAEQRAAKLNIELNERAALAENQSALLRTILAAAPMAVRIARLSDNKVVFLNRSFSELVRRSEQDALDLDISKCYVDPEVFANIRVRLQSGETVLNELVELHLPDKPEVGHVWVLASYMAIDYEQQKSVLAWLFDVTALHNAREAADASSTAKSAFLANMSHEIRTPMAAVIGLLQVLAQTPLSANQRDYLEKVDSAAKTLLSLLNDILDFSKIDAGRMDIEYHPMLLEQFFRDLSVVLASSIGNKPIEVLYDIDSAIPSEVMADLLRLKQIFVNLAGNAIKFTSTGQVVVAAKLLHEVPIRQSERENVDWVEFRISDSGIGIAEENIPKLFSAFSQAEASTTRKFGGTGLGLAICKRLVEMMGGTIRVESQLGSGTSFIFALPFRRVVATNAGNSFETPLERTAHHVLLVDDNPVAAQLIESTLQSFGWSVVLAGTGTEAAAKFAQHLLPQSQHFSLVYLDSSLAGLDGWDTMKRIDALARDAGLPAPKYIMLSATGRDHLGTRTDKEQSMLSAFLIKPVTPSMLFNASLRMAGDGSSVRRTQRANKRELKGLRILVVDDNAINQQVAEELLGSQGAAVSIAPNGLEGTKAVAAADPAYDIVLMDIQMPVMDGYTATEYIRKNLGMDAHQLPIIGLTANALSTDRERCLQAGMNDHVGKPFDLARLVSTIIRLTGKTSTAEDPVPALEPWTSGEVDEPYQGALQATAELELEKALARLGGSESLYVNSGRLWIKATPDYLEKLELAAQRDDFHSALEIIHTLKGTSGTMGLTRLSARLAACEAELRASANCHALGQSLPELQQQLSTASEVLASAIAGFSERNTQESVGANAERASTAEVQSLLTTITGYLEQGDLEALNTFATNKNVLQAMAEDDFAALDAALLSLDLESALAVCRRALRT